MLIIVQPHSERQQNSVTSVAAIWTAMDTLTPTMPSLLIQHSGAMQTVMDLGTRAQVTTQMLVQPLPAHRLLTDSDALIAIRMVLQMKT